MVEGCGANGCEYMTGGVVVVLGAVGDNFARGHDRRAGLRLDPQGALAARLNGETVAMSPVRGEAAEALRRLVEAHARETGSRRAVELLDDWADALEAFVEVAPRVAAAKAERKRA